jgi:hypothetical protein
MSQDFDLNSSSRGVNTPVAEPAREALNNISHAGDTHGNDALARLEATERLAESADASTDRAISNDTLPSEDDVPFATRKFTALDTNPFQNDVELVIQPARVAGALLFVVACLLGAGVVATVGLLTVDASQHPSVHNLLTRFDLSRTASLARWFTSGSLAGSAFLFALVAVWRRRAGAKDGLAWVGLSAMFYTLSLDTWALFHTPLLAAMQRSLSAGSGYLAWAIPSSLVAVALLAFYIRFLGRLQARSRWLLLVAGATFAVGTLLLASSHDGLGRDLSAVVEAGSVAFSTSTFATSSIASLGAEFVGAGLQMLGAVLVVYTLLDYLQRHLVACHCSFDSAS